MFCVRLGGASGSSRKAECIFVNDGENLLVHAAHGEAPVDHEPDTWQTIWIGRKDLSRPAVEHNKIAFLHSRSIMSAYDIHARHYMRHHRGKSSKQEHGKHVELLFKHRA